MICYNLFRSHTAELYAFLREVGITLRLGGNSCLR